METMFSMRLELEPYKYLHCDPVTLPFIKGGTKKEGEKTKVLTLNKYMAMGPSGGSMPRVTVLAGCRQ
jgi:hypothetical protein